MKIVNDEENMKFLRIMLFVVVIFLLNIIVISVSCGERPITIIMDEPKVCTPGQYKFDGGSIVYICGINGNEWFERLNCYYGVGYKDCHDGCIDGVHFGGYYCIGNSLDDKTIVYGSIVDVDATQNVKENLNVISSTSIFFGVMFVIIVLLLVIVGLLVVKRSNYE